MDRPLFILIWAVLILLALGLAGVIRALRILALRLDERTDEPRRIQPGDHLRLPADLDRRLSSHQLRVLLFVKPACKACSAALESLKAVGGGNVCIAALYHGSVDEDYPAPDYSVPHQTEVFSMARVGIVPFAVLMNGTEVVARSWLGDEESRRRFSTIVETVSRSPLPGAVPLLESTRGDSA